MRTRSRSPARCRVSCSSPTTGSLGRPLTAPQWLSTAWPSELDQLAWVRNTGSATAAAITGASSRSNRASARVAAHSSTGWIGAR
ncbi:hypothetical protein ACOQFL_17350 [Actinopolyspora sp. H202]|uniref:hypothetical protein n=1 Tax=Actinopolyspora sp. H202 TaxID=1500456 RepID=UPI003EE76B04